MQTNRTWTETWITRNRSEEEEVDSQEEVN